MTKLLYFICQLIIGWIEYDTKHKPVPRFDLEKYLHAYGIDLDERCNHAYKDESVSVNATDDTQPVKVRRLEE